MALTGEFDPQTVSNTIWSYATLGITPGAALLAALEKRAVAVAGARWACRRRSRAVGMTTLTRDTGGCFAPFRSRNQNKTARADPELEETGVPRTLKSH